MTAMIKEKEMHNQRHSLLRRRLRMLLTTINVVSLIALAVMIWFYAVAEKGKQAAQKQLRIAEETIRIADESIKETLRKDSIARLEKQTAETALQEAKQRIAELEAEKAERNRIEVEKYIASARRMMRVGDRDMAHQILLEAQKLDKANADIIALLKEIE
ncbi:MAG: hypothetical protein SGI94_06620 [Saprospiraceae bacterium]|mgnify:CR=1 FL=1|nr:hypothetical protein [Saprospiraceae bacterium]